MHKRQNQQVAACLTAFALVAAAFPEGLVDTAKLPTQMHGMTIQQFAADVQSMHSAVDFTEQFAALRFDPSAGTLQCDGKTVGTQFAGFSVVDGKLVVSAQSIANAAQKDAVRRDETVSLERAAAAIGCEVQTLADGTVMVTAPFASGRLIVQSAETLEPFGAVDTVEGYRDLHVLQYETAADAYAAYQTYQQMEGVDFVTPDRLVTICDVEDAEAVEAPEDAELPLYQQNVTWGVSHIGADSYCDWLTSTQTDLPEVTVAVIDTGINAEHEWFEGRIAEGGVNLDEPMQGFPVDEHGHGTHCAGIICSSTPENVKILPIRALDGSGSGSNLQIYCAMVYAAEQNADVISMSLGCWGEDALLEEGVKVVAEKQIPLCVAAGNESTDAVYHSPARESYPLTVAAVSSDNYRAYFSNFGAGIDLAAPGVGILSAGIASPTDIVSMDGTSMATPYVAAACADLLSYQPDLSFETMQGYLFANAIDVGETGFDSQYGWGVLNLANFRFSAAYCTAPEISPAGGNYEEAVTVELSCATEHADIYYTLDGSTPTPETATHYDGTAISLTESAVLQAISVCEDYSSAIVTERYCINGKDLPNALVVENGVLVAYHGVQNDLDLFDRSDIVAIADGVFEGNNLLKTVNLPDSTQKIGARAFAACENLERVSCGELLEVGDEAFRGCSSLERFLATDLQQLGENVFRDCSALQFAGQVGSLERLPAGTFAGCRNLNMGMLGVKEIGAEAFFDANLAMVQLNWEWLTVLEDNAFHNASGLTRELDLRNVETLGAYALSGTNIESLTLPKTLTAIPEGLLYNCDALLHLSAPAVTEVGAFGLALDSYNFLTCDIDFSKLEHAGTAAFSGIQFGEPVHFDALQDTNLNVLDGAVAPAIYAPSITTATQYYHEDWDQVGGISLRADVVYVENLASIEDYAFMSLDCLVVGDALTEIAEAAFDNLPYNTGMNVFAGPEDSLLQSVCAEWGFEYHVTPFAYTTCSNVNPMQCDYVELTGYPLGFGLSGSWYVLDPETGARELLNMDGSPVVSFRAIEAGTTVYCYAMFDETTGEELDSVTYEVEVAPVQIHELEPNLVQVIPPGEESAVYRFVPTEDITASFRYDAEDCEMFTAAETQHLWNSSDFSMQGGTEYFFRFSLDQDAYSAFCLWDGPTEFTLVVSSATLPKNVFDESELPLTLTPIVASEFGGTFTEGESYAVYGNVVTEPGNGFCYVIGIGKYYYYERLSYDVRAQLKLDTQKEITSKKLSLEFKPEHDGTYDFFDMYAESTIAEAAAQGTSLHCDTVLTIIDGETGSEIGYNDDGYSLMPYLSVELEAGRTYIIEEKIYNDSQDAARVLMVTQNEHQIFDYTVEAPFTCSRYDTPNIFVYTPDGDPLAMNRDYSLTTWVDYESYVVHYVINGIGDYVGQITDEIQLEDESVSDLKKTPIALEKPFVMDEEHFYFTLELSTACEITLQPEAGAAMPELIFWSGTDEPDFENLLGSLNEETPTMRLRAGSYSCICSAEFQEDESLTATLHMVRALTDLEEDVDVSFDPILEYTGSMLVPEITLKTAEGTELIEGTDYTLTVPEQAIACSTYVCIVEGIGGYIGTLNLSYDIVPPRSNDLPLLTEGRQTAEIPAVGDFLIYRWIPQANTALIDSQSIFETEVNVYDDSGALVGSSVGMLYNAEEIEVLAGETYYVMVGFTGNTQSGSFDFTVTTDYRMLEHCEVEGSEYALYTGSAIAPAFQITDGEKTLVEGEDYYLLCDVNTEGPGIAEYTFIGMGDYHGDLSLNTNIYLDGTSDDGLPTTVDSIEEITFQQTHNLVASVPTEQHLLRFTNQTGERKSFSLEHSVPEYIYDIYEMLGGEVEGEEFDLETYAFTYQFYDAETLAFLGTEKEMPYFTLDPDESIYMLAIARAYDCVPELFAVDLRIKEYIPREEVIVNGVTYTVYEDGTAVITAVAPDTVGLLLLDTVDSETMTGELVGVDVDDATMLRLAHECVIYGTADGQAEDIATAMGWAFVPLDGTSALQGDLNCDGVVNATDVQILSIWLTEGNGLQIPAQLFAAADLDADEMLTLSDCMLLMRAAQ